MHSTSHNYSVSPKINGVPSLKKSRFTALWCKTIRRRSEITHDTGTTKQMQFLVILLQYMKLIVQLSIDDF